MQSRSTLLALAGLFAAFTLGKRSSSKTTSAKESLDIVHGQIGSKEIGYKIVNCKLTIYDKQKAWNYAFKLGADDALINNIDEYTWSTKPIKKKLVGDCFGSEVTVKSLINSKEKAFFIFELFRYLNSGIASKSEVYDTIAALNDIESFKSNIEKVLSYDTSNYKIELIELDYN